MKRLGTLLAACIVCTSAWASNNVSGTITSIDPERHQLVIDGGKPFPVAANVTLVGLRPGDKVTVSTDVQNGVAVISKIEETTPQTPAPTRIPAPATP